MPPGLSGTGSGSACTEPTGTSRSCLDRPHREGPSVSRRCQTDEASQTSPKAPKGHFGGSLYRHSISTGGRFRRSDIVADALCVLPGHVTELRQRWRRTDHRSELSAAVTVGGLVVVVGDRLQPGGAVASGDAFEHGEAS